MATETHPDVSKDRQRLASGVSLGIFLIGLGVLVVTGWWWPGIMIVLGLASGGELIFRGKFWAGVASLAFFCGIAVAVELIIATEVSWVLVAAMILIGLGVITLVKAFVLRE